MRDDGPENGTSAGGAAPDERGHGRRGSGRWRWCVLAVLGAAAAIAGAIVWLVLDLSGQERVLLTISGGGIVLISAWAWVLVLAPFSLRRRFHVAGGVLLAAGACAALVRVRGVTGDLRPLLQWSWRSEAWEGRAAGRHGSLEERSRRPSVAPGAALGLPGPEDYPQFLGAERTGVVRGVRLERDWKSRPPRLRWRRPVGAAWSSFAVTGGCAFTQEQRGDQEMVVCYDLASGAEIWTHADAARYEHVIAGEGPRSTPAVSGGRIYTVGATGLLDCLEGATGALLWQRDFVGENGARNNEWGKSCSPLVAGGLVVVSAGGPAGKSLAAYRAESGELAWAGGDDRSAYSSPVAAALAGRQQIVIFNRASVAAHDPATGEMLWSYPWSSECQNVSQPVAIEGDRLLVSSGYGVGAELLQVRGEADGRLAAAPLWKSKHLKAKFSNTVVRDGFAYGLDDGILACIDLADGNRRWKGGRYGHGQIILAGDILLVQTENGAIVLVEASSAAHRELARLQALDDKTWNHPALAGRTLLVRNSREAACYELP